MIVKGAYFYQNGTIRLATLSLPSLSPFVNSERGTIKKLSAKSRQRMALIVHETDVHFESLLTLTYPAEWAISGKLNGKTVKRHLNGALVKLRIMYGKGLAYFWIVEFTKRGLPHFHILLNVVPCDSDRFHFALQWSEAVGLNNNSVSNKVFYVHNRPEAWSEIRLQDGAKRYLLKYALKPYQKFVPTNYQDVGRFWGCNANVLRGITKPTYIRTGEDDLREYLVNIGNPCGKFNRLPLVIFSREKPAANYGPATELPDVSLDFDVEEEN